MTSSAIMPIARIQPFELLSCIEPRSPLTRADEWLQRNSMLDFQAMTHLVAIESLMSIFQHLCGWTIGLPRPPYSIRQVTLRHQCIYMCSSHCSTGLIYPQVHATHAFRTYSPPKVAIDLIFLFNFGPAISSCCTSAAHFWTFWFREDTNHIPIKTQSEVSTFVPYYSRFPLSCTCWFILVENNISESEFTLSVPVSFMDSIMATLNAYNVPTQDLSRAFYNPMNDLISGRP